MAKTLFRCDLSFDSPSNLQKEDGDDADDEAPEEGAAEALTPLEVFSKQDSVEEEETIQHDAAAGAKV